MPEPQILTNSDLAGSVSSIAKQKTAGRNTSAGLHVYSGGCAQDFAAHPANLRALTAAEVAPGKTRRTYFRCQQSTRVRRLLHTSSHQDRLSTPAALGFIADLLLVKTEEKVQHSLGGGRIGPRDI